MNSDGSLLAGTSFPKNVSGVSHTAGSGIYCVGLSGGIDPGDAVVSAAEGAVGVYTVPASPDCASGEVEVDAFSWLTAAPRALRCPRSPQMGASRCWSREPPSHPSVPSSRTTR